MASAGSAQLSPTFYHTSCPGALETIRSGVMAAVSSEPRMGASLVRLHFHDCFLDASLTHPLLSYSCVKNSSYTRVHDWNICTSFQGCDGSVLLADTGSFVGEQGAAPNAGSIRGMNVIDNIKTQVEAICPQTVSCADILAVAARDSVFAGLHHRKQDKCRKRPASSYLRSVTLSDAHTIGQSQCKNFRGRIYNDTNINTAFATSLKANCPQATSSDDSNLAPLDKTTPNVFDNAYYSNLLTQKWLLHSDQVLFNGGGTDNTVMSFASNPAAFGSAFATAMVNMGNIAPKTGTQGQIRLICSKVNA
ncbi:unnamed protein product [Alopecurus aequalis]